MARKGKIHYGCKVTNGMFINDDVSTVMSGFDISGTMAFCVKRSETKNKCDIYKLDKFETASKQSDKRTIPVKGYGMTYFAQNLYITTDNNKVVRVPYAAGDVTTDFFKVVSMDGKALNATAITARAKNEFILMANSLNVDKYLCFSECTLDSVKLELKEHRRYYVKNSALPVVKDIYHDNKYGLFIVTNEEEKNGIARSNLISRIDLNRYEKNGYLGYDLYYPASRYSFVAGDTYTRYTIESVSIASKGDQIGKMYAVANILKTDGTIYDRMLYFNNFTFYADKPCSILTDSYSIVDVPYVNEGTCECLNAGALALDGEIGYCLESDTKDENKDEASVLLRTLDINSESFKRFAPKAGAGVYTNMGHGNGMTYYDGALYVAAYIREDLKNNIAAMQHIVKLSAEGNVLGEYELDKGSCIGSIAHYRDNLFILGEYNHLGRTDNSGELTYAFEPMFYIGYFQNNRFIKTRTFSVTNPTFSLEIPPEKESASNVLQDIHYDDEFGLYYVTYTNGVSHMFRISPERVESAGIEVTEPMEPDEQFEFGTAFGEVESLSISALVHAPGAMYVAGKKGGNKVHRVTGTKFYRADLA